MGTVDIIATLVLVCIILLAVGVAYYFKNQLMSFFRLKGGRIGDPCTLHTDCADWGPAATDNACCQGVCTQKQADWAGVGYCPQDCKGWPSTTNTYGTCNQTSRCPAGYIISPETGICCPSKDGKICDDLSTKKGWCSLNDPGKPYSLCSSISGLYHWPRLEGEICSLDTDCTGWGPGSTDTACCSGFCRKKQVDYLGIGWCPEACKGWIGAKGGTCKPNDCPPGFTRYGNNQCCDSAVVNGVCQGTSCDIQGTNPATTCSLYTGIWHTPRSAGEECSDIRACASGLGCCPGIGAFNPPTQYGAPRVCLPLINGQCPQNVNTGCT